MGAATGAGGIRVSPVHVEDPSFTGSAFEQQGTLITMELGLHGKVAVVTGASKGIGLAIVWALLSEGATVIAGARSTSPELAELPGNGQLKFVHPSEIADVVLFLASDKAANVTGQISPSMAG